MGKTKVDRDDILYEDEIKETLKNCKRLDVQALISILWMTGARINEVLALRGKDLIVTDEFLAINIITLKQRVKEGQLPVRRILKIPKDNLYYTIIKEYVNKSKILPDKRLFQFGYHYAWKLIKDSNVNIYPHLFRHSRATILSNNIDVYDLKEWFGWKKIEMAEKYVHRKRSIDKVFSVLKSESKPNPL